MKSSEYEAKYIGPYYEAKEDGSGARIHSGRNG